MANRVTATEVKEIMDNCTVLDAVVETFITASEAVITKVFASDTSISATLLKEIERWFTAHMIASTLHRTTAHEEIDDVRAIYTGKWGMGLDSTPYGQMTKQLDTTGKMSNIGKQAASIYAVKSFDS
jgi:hypothetical protein